MKNQLQWLLQMVMITLIACMVGCASLWVGEPMYKKVDRADPDFYSKPILSDEIVAIGSPDAALAKEMGQTNVIAFIGKKNTYMLHKGGEALEKISRLKLDKKRINIDADKSISLYQKDNKVWGELILTYGGDVVVTTEEKLELEKVSFTAIQGAKNNLYQTKVRIEGVIYPAITLTDEQLSKFTKPHAFNLYNPRDSTPTMMGQICNVTLVALGAGVIDSAIFSLPVGLIGGTAVLVIGIKSVVNGTWDKDKKSQCW